MKSFDIFKRVDIQVLNLSSAYQLGWISFEEYIKRLIQYQKQRRQKENAHETKME